MNKDIDRDHLFKAGTYRAELSKPIAISAKVTVDNDKIKDVEIRTLDGTQNIEPELKDLFKGQIIKAQSVNIDGITSASILTKSVKSVVGDALADARIK